MNSPTILWGSGEIKLHAVKSSLCIYCLGSRALCGRRQCPIMLRYSKLQPVVKLDDKTMIDGSSPPGVFVGRIGYPKIGIGPMVPPYFGDTRMLDYPESWWSIDLEKLVEYRSSLVRGIFKADARKPWEAGRLLQITQEIAMATQPIEAYMEFSKPVQARILLDEDAQPFGPYGLVEKIESGNVKVNRFIEKAYYDEDLKASEAIYYLYSLGVPVSAIQKAFSVAVFGLGKRRRLVPTRWSITAVDNTLAEKILEKVKENPEVNEYSVYEAEHIGNKFIVVVMPGKWSYEFVEMFHPGSVWNVGSGNIAVGSDYEDAEGRTTYARIGGCYYAARLAVVEYLHKNMRQGSVLVLREAGPEYILPVGVWLVRENVRKALAGKPVLFSSLDSALSYVAKKLRTPWQLVIKESRLLRNIRERRRITEYLKEK